MIKSEPSDSVPIIKRDPDGVHGEDDDDDNYEDAGDLDMTHGKRGLWLVKLPKFLLEQWENMDDDEEITLGEILVSQDERVSSALFISRFLVFYRDGGLNLGCIW